MNSWVSAGLDVLLKPQTSWLAEQCSLQSRTIKSKRRFASSWDSSRFGFRLGMPRPVRGEFHVLSEQRILWISIILTDFPGWYR